MAKIQFNGKPHPSSGIVGKISFKNPTFMDGLRAMFHAKDYEVIIAVEIDDRGVKAYFEHKPTEGTVKVTNQP